MAKDHVVALSDGALPQSMDVRGTDGDGQWLTDRIQRTKIRFWLLDPAGFADF